MSTSDEHSDEHSDEYSDEYSDFKAVRRLVSVPTSFYSTGMRDDH